MKSVISYRDYDPKSEYQEETRREINLENIRKSSEYADIIDLGFEDLTSHQQEINNTLKFQRKNQPHEEGYGDVFYTVHPSGSIRRYNPAIEDEQDSEFPEGQGNPIRSYPSPFRNSMEYKKALRYLFNYLRRKELRNNFR